jgi:type II secretory pathway pseudopilin PulG
MARALSSRLHRDERGFSLVEQLVVCAGLTIILAAILGLSEVATKLAPTDRERVHAVRDAQVSLDKMTRELRTAHAITIEPFKATATVLKNGASTTVTYDCSGAAVNGLRTCTRAQTGISGTTKAIERIANPDARPVFTAQTRNDTTGNPWTTYVRTLIEVPSKGERSTGGTSNVVLDDGFYLRNIDALH